MKVNDMVMLDLKDQKGTKLELCRYKLHIRDGHTFFVL